MDIKIGDCILIHHYSAVNAIKSTINEFSDESISVIPRNSTPVMQFYEGDPVTFKHEEIDKVVLVSCSIYEIDKYKGYLNMLYEQIDFDRDKREAKRYPVSLYAFVKNSEMVTRPMTIIKNISQTGMMAYSKEDLPLNREYQFELYFEREVVFLKCIIVRKDLGQHYFEYGLYISFNNQKTMNHIIKYVESL